MKKKTHTHYITGLDGLRAIAVLAVIAYHFRFDWAEGGFLGVSLFFVLSGYLITSTLLPDQNKSMKLDLKKFWVGRARRLLPASYAMIFITFVWVVLFHQNLLSVMRGDALASLFYVSNWWFIFHEVSYFDSFAAPSPIKNLWSLAIEEQFYLLWPLVLTVLIYIFKNRATVSRIIFLSALLSCLWMSLQYDPNGDPSRVYYGTDTRSFELLIGCWLALVWPMKRLSAKKLSPQLKQTLNVTSIGALVILLLCMFTINEYNPFLYIGGMFLIALLSAVVIACVCHPSSILSKWLSWKPLRWIGTRSYGIYLWHYPIIILTTPVDQIASPQLWRVLLQLIAIFAIAEVSYRFLEQPIRKYGFRAFFKNFKKINPLKWKSLNGKYRMGAAFVPLAAIIFIAGMTGVVKGEEQEEKPTELVISQENSTDQPKEETKEEASNVPEKNDSSKEAPKEKTEGTEEVEDEVEIQAEPLPAAEHYNQILAIGDSLMLDVAPSLQLRFPAITIDAKVGRQVHQAVDVSQQYISFNQKENAIIFMLGTNGFFREKHLDQLIDLFSEADIYLVNTKVPRSWEEDVNDALLKKAEGEDHVTLVDWHELGENHPEYFGGDGVHVGKTGAESLAELIEKEMNNYIEASIKEK
ncbi:acyltransferase family protein [Cytobacillus sp. FSL K6-0265]|uniref:acyltransferase family protein n=1 Tax=Cytobacillus sp. FSL K6-0265 TaxID=2921448 RepID=UPI0030FCE366